MARRDEDFGRFGDIEPVGKGGTLGSLFKTAVGGVVLAGIATIALKGWSGFFTTIIEREPPLIKYHGEITGVGVEGSKIELTVSDAQAGIAEVIIRLEQGDRLRTKLAEAFDAGVHEKRFEIPLGEPADELHEGKMQLIITAYDNSYWRNMTQSRVPLDVDLTRPRPALVWSQTAVAAGKVGLVFYRISEEKKVLNGVTVGAALFPGFPAKALDQDFAAAEDLYFALFGLPLAVSGGEMTQVFARDVVGNSAMVPFAVKATPSSVNTIKRSLTQEFLETRVEPVYQQYIQDKAKRERTWDLEYFPAIHEEELIERFQTLQSDYRPWLEQQLNTLFTSPKQARYWRDEFVAPGGKPSIITFGTEIQIEYRNQLIAQTTSKGHYFEAAAASPIRAVNDGVVIFADKLGEYGNSLIVDHGLGLSSMYTHLGPMSRREGDRVSRGEQIAAVEASGLAWESGFGFQLRLDGQPVDPDQWLNFESYRETIASGIAEAKRAAGIPIRTKLN